MAFFDDLGKTIMGKGQEVWNKTKDLSEIAKLNIRISDLQRKNEDIYAAIGKLYMEHYGNHPETLFQDAVASIKENQKKIVSCREEIKILKGYHKCENCGADVANGSQFCPSCGSKVKEDHVVADAEVVTEAEGDFREVSEEEENVCAESAAEAPAGEGETEA